MTENGIRTKGSREVDVRKLPAQDVFGGKRPYYWSWYRTVFDEPASVCKMQPELPEH